MFVLLACPARAGHGSQHPTASLCTPGPKLSFHGAPGDPGVGEAGWPQGPSAKCQETAVAVATAELLGRGACWLRGNRLQCLEEPTSRTSAGRPPSNVHPLAFAGQAGQWGAGGSAPQGHWRGQGCRSLRGPWRVKQTLHSRGPCLAGFPGRPPSHWREVSEIRLCPGERSSRWVGSMSLGPLSPDTRRRLLQGQAGPLPEPPTSSVAIFISSTVSGKGQGLGAGEPEQ